MNDKTMRAKFVVWSVAKNLGVEGETQSIELRLGPVVSDVDGKSNASWSKYTPSGEMRMVITNEELFDTFRPGQQFYLDFTRA